MLSPVIVKRWHAGHSHDHTHGEEQAQLMKALKGAKDPGSRITLIGMGVNVGLTALKGVGGWLTNSASLVADAAHSLSDLISDVVTLYTFNKARQPSDIKHPFGYGRYEAIGTLGVSSFLVLAGIGIGQHSIELLLETLPSLVETSIATSPIEVVEETSAATSPKSSVFPSLFHSHEHHSTVSPNALWFALISVFSKEALYRASKRSTKTNSQVLAANAWHHRSDAYSSLVAVAAILGAYAGFPALDPIGGIIVSGMILKSGVGMGLGALKELTDVRLSPATAHQVEDFILECQPDLATYCEVAKLRGRKTGPFYHLEVTLHLQSQATVEQATQVQQVLRKKIEDNHHLKDFRDVVFIIEDKRG
ncbi:cation efflux protein [Basidiobolus meristosporus CBS 931.73]|uniref:Cation efflux protein n=1 Tax=Basidiobolus meristosporus CBS 931.73 TaxID=1314790 RepID=A0A1Y1X5Q6_9FUNG|nr:cation efflux protein [Basidiobolus meristosporus CBS 931.73]|eukprot:ORX81150.1 cation efflux protein [Basidiobolus meristosporus CBS 931.73]